MKLIRYVGDACKRLDALLCHQFDQWTHRRIESKLAQLNKHMQSSTK